jgi:hypothetical protein
VCILMSIARVLVSWVQPEAHIVGVQTHWCANMADLRKGYSMWHYIACYFTALGGKFAFERHSWRLCLYFVVCACAYAGKHT